MPEIFINGQAVQVQAHQTVMQAARASGHHIPGFCWHPHLSVAGNCRVCVVEVRNEDDSTGWLDIACNLPASAGLRVVTDSNKVRARRQETLQFITLNHPVDCGICDKAGECLLQDYHVAYNDAPSTSHEPKLRGDKHVPLSTRIVLDQERCILCTRCVRFTHEVSKSQALGVSGRGDRSVIRAAEDGAFERDAYSDNVIDLCPVGALQPQLAAPGSRVWYLQATPSVCPGCARGCSVSLWHRKSEWRLKTLTPCHQRRIERVTPRDNPEVNGPWICNKGRDLATTLERPRALQHRVKGEPASLAQALARAHTLLASAQYAVALVSSWASNEELQAFATLLSARMTCYVKADQQAAPGEVLEDGLLIKADKNPNTTAARALFAAMPDDPRQAFAAGTDLVLVWGEGFARAQWPAQAAVIALGSWQHADHEHADVFFAISAMTEHGGHFTNFAGGVSAFESCFDKPAGVVDTQALFTALAATAQEALA